jgi:hypothetical protein
LESQLKGLNSQTQKKEYFETPRRGLQYKQLWRASANLCHFKTGLKTNSWYAINLCPSGDEWLSRVCFVAHLTSLRFVRCATYLFLEEGFPGNPGTGHVT